MIVLMTSDCNDLYQKYSRSNHLITATSIPLSCSSTFLVAVRPMALNSIGKVRSVSLQVEFICKRRRKLE